jgi:hypothetical protein
MVVLTLKCGVSAFLFLCVCWGVREWSLPLWPLRFYFVFNKMAHTSPVLFDKKILAPITLF